MSMATNYWEKITTRRLNRRRALMATGGAAAAAAFLAACGGDDDDAGDSGGTGVVDRSGLLASPKDETSSRKRGGTLNIAGPPAGTANATLEQSLGGNGS